jgi:hypothetical protein
MYRSALILLLNSGNKSFIFQYDEVNLKTREEFVALQPGKLTVLNNPILQCCECIVFS